MSDVAAPAVSATPSPAPKVAQTVENNRPENAHHKPAYRAEPPADKKTPAQPTTNEPVKGEPVKLWKLRDGDKELTLDSEDKLTAYAQKGYGLDKKVSELSRTVREKEELLRLAESDPDAFFQKMGKDPRKLYEERLLRQLDEEENRAKLSPQEVRWRKEVEAQSQAAQQAQQELEHYRQIEHKRNVDHKISEIDDSIMKALNSPNINLPKTERTVARMAELMLEADANNLDISPDQVATFVSQEMETEVLELFGHMSGEQLLTKMPQEIIQKIRQADLARFRAQRAPGNPEDVRAVQQRPAADQPQKKKFLSKLEWERQLESRMK